MHPPHRGDVISGVGALEYILVRVCPGTYGGGVVLGVGTTRIGGLRCGHNPKKGVLGTCTVKTVVSYELVLHKERALGTEVAQKWVLGSLFITYLYVYLYI